MSGSPTYLIHDTNDDIQLVRTIHQSVDTSPAAIACRIAPPARQRAEVVWDLLRALGKRADLPGTPLSPGWLDAERWLAAHQVIQLIVLRAHHVDRETSEGLIALARRLGVEVWLVVHGAHQPPAGLRAQTRSISELVVRPAGRPARRARRSWPAVPDCHPFLFRALCAALLRSHDRFHRLDRLLNHVARATDRWLALHQDAAPDDLRALVCLTAASEDAMSTRVRLCGLQLGLAVHGLALTADRRAIERAISTLRPRPLIRDELLATHGYADPIRAKQLLTALVTGLPASYLAMIDADQITRTMIAGYRTPPQARAIAAAGWCRTEGRLFATGAYERHHVSDDSVARTIQELRRTAGLDATELGEHRSTLQVLRVAFAGARAVAPSPDAEILRRLLTERRFGVPASSLDSRAVGRLSVACVIRCARERIQLSDIAAYSAYATTEPPHHNSTDIGWHEALARAGNPADI